MEQQRISHLLEKHLAGTLDDAERQELEALIQQPDTAAWEDAISLQLSQQDDPGEAIDQQAARAAVARIVSLDKRRMTATYVRPWWHWAAAAVLLFCLAGTYFWYQYQPGLQPDKVEMTTFAPGTTKAMLTLADGSKVALDSTGNQLIDQGGTAVRQQGGQLLYEADRNNKTVSYNTLTTPSGGQFKVVLPDGSRVWLNAASSIRYPTAFTGTERRVELTGEGYLEVAKNEHQPFRVIVNDQTEIEVLGTQFNINSYTDEPVVRTTLVEGRVRVLQGKASAILQPGQQAIIQNGITVDKHANVDGAVAWKNGQFNFDGATLDEFMRQLARWYDIKVVYKGKVPDKSFQGKLGRDLDLYEILAALNDFGIQYKLEGKTLIIE
ncbi:FecR domain-containing protein [Chitinophaga defluvii]|uniref:FecR domain-containing protein n=1 Tax=Chitinophaga defluvii TaxID=3163343 RepID=A0ABV2T0E2_9BACT